jgi:hypothetical protein
LAVAIAKDTYIYTFPLREIMQSLLILLLAFVLSYDGCHSMTLKEERSEPSFVDLISEPIVSQHISPSGFIVSRRSSSVEFRHMNLSSDFYFVQPPYISSIVYADILTMNSLKGQREEEKQLFIFGNTSDGAKSMYILTLSSVEPKYKPMGIQAFHFQLEAAIESITCIFQTSFSTYLVIGSMASGHFISIVDPIKHETTSLKAKWPFLPIHSCLFRHDYLFLSLTDSDKGGSHQVSLKIDGDLTEDISSVFMHCSAGFYVPFPRNPNYPIFRFVNTLIEIVKIDPIGKIASYAPDLESHLSSPFPVNLMVGPPIYHHDSATLFVHYQMPTSKEWTCYSFTFPSPSSYNASSQSIIARRYDNLPFPEIMYLKPYYFALPGYLKFLAPLDPHAFVGEKPKLVNTYYLQPKSIQSIFSRPHAVIDCTFDAYDILHPKVKEIIPDLLNSTFLNHVPGLPLSPDDDTLVRKKFNALVKDNHKAVTQAIFLYLLEHHITL